VVLTATGLIVAFAALVFWWLFLPRFFLALYVVAALAAGIGYLVYRSQNPAGAKQLESKVTAELTTVAVQLIALWHTVTANSQFLNTGHGGPHQRTAAPYTPLPAARTRPASSGGPQQGFVPQAPYTSGSRPNQGHGANSAALSALLIIPSLIAYGIIYNNTGFGSAWGPWAILMALNGYFVLCVAARARLERRAGAVLLAVVAAAAYAFVTSPSPDVGLGAMMQATIAKAESAADIHDLALWSQRAPAIAILVFIVAWSLARRRNSSWVLGLLPAAAAVAFSVWYAENKAVYVGWFGLWLLNVGVLVAGCVACWAADGIGGSPKATNPALPIYPPTI
jgi:hypothetical protein